VGIYYLRSGQLASPDLAFARSRLHAIWTEPRRPPLHEPVAAHHQRRSSLSAAAECYRISLAQPDGCRSIRASSHQRGVRGVGVRAEECFEHDVFSARSLFPWMVRAQASHRPLRRRGRPLCSSSAQQAAGHRLSVSSFVVGLLAALPYRRSRNDRSRNSTRRCAEVSNDLVGSGEAAAPPPIRRQRCGDHHSSTSRRRRQNSLSLQPAVAFRNRCNFVRQLPWQGILAREIGWPLSSSHATLPRVEDCGRRIFTGRHHRLSHPRARAPISVRGMVLVSRQPDTNDRAGASRLLACS
jgi:hypothetical protein